MAAKKAARRSTRRSRSKPARRTRKSPARRAAARPKTRHTRAKATRRAKPARAAKAAAKTRRAKRPARKPAASATRRAVARRPAAAKPARRPASPPAPKPATAATATKDRRPRPAAKPALDRARRILPEAERTEREADDRLIASARSGGDELRHELREHTETSPTLTAGDVDADWQDAYAVGDEAPGGDNPTPDQDRVDEIGKALGVNYDASEELQGSEKIVERDRHRWELDPASSDDWPHGDKD